MDKNIKKVGLFVPCCIDQIAPQSAFKALHLLEGLGIDCYYPDTQTCCGKELYDLGDKNGAKQLGEKMIEQFGECQYVVSLSSACVVHIQKHFAQLFHNTTFHNSYRQMIDKCVDLTDFLVNVLNYSPTAPFAHKVVYMDHCTTLHDYRSPFHPDRSGLHDEPRQLLARVPQLQLTEMEQNDVCCGLGGHFASDFTPIADSLTRRKVNNAIETGAEIITSSEPTCLMHLQAFMDKADINLKCLNIIDILVPEEI